MTDELKKALVSAKTEEEAKAVAEKFKDEIKKLTPKELERVSGGSQVYNQVMINDEKLEGVAGVVAFATPGPDKYAD